LIVFGVLFLLVGGLLVLHGYELCALAAAATEWPTTTGVVVRSYVRDARLSSSSRAPAFYPMVEYRYVVAEREYFGWRIRTAETGAGDRAEAEAVVAYYHPGREVSVYVDPSNPNTAMLQPGAAASERKMAWVGLVCAACGFGLMIAGRRSGRRAPAP
jgi:hypothetical protein